MIARREVWKYSDSGKVWVGKYRNSQNLLHWHPDCELLSVEHGKIDVFCEGKKHTLTEGQALYIDSGQVHYMSASDPDTVLIVIVFDYDIIRGFAENFRLSSPVLSGSYDLSSEYRALRETLLSRHPFFGAEAACRVLSLMIDIFRKEELEEKNLKDNRTTERFKQLLEEINARYRFISFGDAASFMGMSPSYFSRYFAKTTGITFSQQLNSVRTDNAVQLLRENDGKSMTEIADLCGFGTIRNFNRIFKEYTGFSPRELPRDYNMSVRFSYPSDRAFNPTLYDCELIESTMKN